MLFFSLFMFGLSIFFSYEAEQRKYPSESIGPAYASVYLYPEMTMEWQQNWKVYAVELQTNWFLEFVQAVKHMMNVLQCRMRCSVKWKRNKKKTRESFAVLTARKTNGKTKASNTMEGYGKKERPGRAKERTNKRRVTRNEVEDTTRNTTKFIHV